MSLLLTIYNKLTPNPIIFELFGDVGLEFIMFGSLVSIDKIALKFLRSKLYLFKRIVMPIKLFSPLPKGVVLDNCLTYFLSSYYYLIF
jgi:hypothetical protein